MKLILCPECHDVVKLIQEETRSCKCGKSSGKYRDELNAEISGKAIPLGFDNSELRKAVLNRRKTGRGIRFAAFVISHQCYTITEADQDA